MGIALDLPHDFGIPNEIVLDLLHDQGGLLRSAGDHGDQAAGVEDPHRDAAKGGLPGLAVAAALDHHERVGVAKFTGDDPLSVLQLDLEVALDEDVQVGAPEVNLPCP